MNANKRQKLKSFLRALLRHWWLLLFSALSLVSTALTFLPYVHVPRLLPIGIAVVLLLFASFRVYSEQYDEMQSLREQKAQINKAIESARNESEQLQSQLMLGQQEKDNLQEAISRLEMQRASLQAEIAQLSVRPYDQQLFIRTRDLVLELRYFERDLLRLVLLNGGEVRGDVIYHARTIVTPDFDLNGMSRGAQEKGLLWKSDNRLTGYATLTITRNLQEVLKDVLYPRNEVEKPFFRGL